MSSLNRKFYSAFAAIATLAIALAVYGGHALIGTRDLVVRLYDEPLISVSYARAAGATLNEASGLMAQGLMLGPGQMPGAVAALRKFQSAINDDLEIVRTRTRDKQVAMELDEAERAITTWFAKGMVILAPPAGGVTSLPLRSMVDRQSAVAAARLDDLVELISADGFTYRTQAQSELRGSIIALATLSGGIVVASFLFALLFGNLLIRPIRAATRIAEHVAAGDFGNVITCTRRDEVGRLLSCLAVMQENLRSRAAQAMALLQEKEQAAEALGKINMRFNTALNNMSFGLLMSGPDSRIAIFNRRFCDIYGLDAAAVENGCAFRELLDLSVAAGNHPGSTVDEVFTEQARFLQSGESGTACHTISGGRIISISYEPMPDGGWISMHEDITARRRSEEQVIFLAHHDALTRLPNRALFLDRLDVALAQAERGFGFALLYLDLDQFKAVNDTLGHPIGDCLLCEVSQRLRGVVRDTDTVARLGGDEFAVIQFGVSSPADAATLAARIIGAICAPYKIEGNQLSIGTSVGIAMAPGDGRNSIQLMKNADLALYKAKHEGRGKSMFFEATMDIALRARRSLELDLRSPSLWQELELNFQPVVCSRTRRVTGFEALLRWRHPTRGLVYPGEFISAAEDIGMIVPIGAWVLEQACEIAASWPNHFKVAVNLSPIQFRDGTLPEIVAAALNNSGIAPERLVLEITESVLLRNNAATLSMLHVMRAHGSRIAMDDFGTGYSSLSYLRSFPFDTIKIDKMFVADLGKSDESIAIVRAVCGLGRSLRMNVIAEGVETEEQFDILAGEECSEIQGYLFSRPIPAQAIPALLIRLSETKHSSHLTLVSDAG
jgi:diguanylate cyclase (GGDEF)-like protein